MTLLKRLISVFFALTLVACATANGPDFTKLSEKQIFNGGEQALAKHNYKEAIDYFEGLQANYPFSKDAEQTQKQVMFAYYKNGDMPSAIAAANRYIRLFPRSPHVDYAYYIKGLADLSENRGVVMRYLPLDLETRDLSGLRDAFNDFSLLLQLFPESPYAPAARQHMVYLRDLLAKHEITVAQYYMRREAYVAAANRASYVVNHFQHAPDVQTALVIMVKAYTQLQEKQMAQDAYRVLQLNYPKHKDLAALKVSLR